MTKNLKKALSLFLAVALLIGILPMSLMSVSAESATTSYTTGSGAKYSVTCDAATVTVGEAIDNALLLNASTTSAFQVTTETMYPILSSTFDVYCSYGSSNPVLFGFEDLKGNCVVFSLSNYNNNAIVYCGNEHVATIPSCTPSRIFNIGVEKVGSSYYMTFDGKAITGDNLELTAATKATLKLENTFSEWALSSDAMFKFTLRSAYLKGNAYLMPRTRYTDNGYAFELGTAFGDRNSGYTGAFNFADTSTSTVTFKDGQYVATLSKGSEIGMLTPVNTNGFYVDVDTESPVVGYYTLSNNTEATLNPVKFSIYSVWPNNEAHKTHSPNGPSTLIYSNAFQYYTSPYADHSPWKHYINAEGKLALMGPNTYAAQVPTTLDCSALSAATSDVYFDYYPNAPITFKMKPGITSESNVTLPEDASDLDATKTAIDSLFGDKARFVGYTYSDFVKATELLYAYEEALTAAAKAVDDKISALPAIDSLIYQDIALVEATRTAYEALTDASKAKVTLLSVLEAYEAKVATLTDNGIFRSEDGDVYRVMYDKEFISLSSHTNGALMAVTNGGQNTDKSYVGIITADKNPILSTSFDAQQQFGTAGNYARFGFVADDCGDDVFKVESNNRFAIYRVASNEETMRYYINIDGVDYECYVANGTTRARVWNVGVTNLNGSYYITLDGKAITGEGYSDDVKEALKLENHFDIEFLKNDSAVHFFMFSPSMFGNSYVRKNREVINGVIVNKPDTYSDRNNSYAAIETAYAGNAAALSQEADNNVYTITTPGTYTIAEPINPAGFFVDLDITAGGNIVKYSFSDTPNGAELASFVIYHNGINAYLVMNNGAQSGNPFANYSTTAHGYWTHCLVNESSLNIIGPYNYGVNLTFNSFNFADLLGEGKKVYLTVTLNVEGTVKVKTGNAIDSVELPENATEEELNAFYSSANRYVESDKLVKASELFIANEAVEVAATFDSNVEYYSANYADYYLYRDEIAELDKAYNAMSARQKENTTTAEVLAEMTDYLSALKNADAENLTSLRKALWNSTEDVVSDYDYYHNDELDILDLVRMKKASLLIEKEDEVYKNLSFPTRTIYASSYGVVGDGVTDDTAAIAAAVNALKASGPDSQLVFEGGKTYLANSIAQGNIEALFELRNCKGLKIDGNGSTFIMAPRLSYAAVTNTKDCVLTEMNFDYKASQAFNATYSASGSVFDQYVDIIADRDLVSSTSGTRVMENGEVYLAPNSYYFCVLDDTSTRFHVGITKYKMLDKETKKVRIYLADNYTHSDFNLLMEKIQTYGLVCPMPEWGHVLAHGFTIMNNIDFTMSNVDIYSCASYGMFVSCNEGVLNFNDVDFVSKDDINFTTWRDAFHVKDNRAVINWSNCEAEFNYDDVFNISATALYVNDYNADSLELTLVCKEKGGNYYPILAGDTINVIDTATGNNCGTVTVKSVVKQADGVNVVVIDKALENFSASGETTLAYFTNRCAPNSSIKNCNFSGTFRFRGPVTVSDTELFNMRTWITREAAIEGPVPENILFKNCTIKSDDESAIIIDSGNNKNNTATGYHVNNISFENCKFDSNANFAISDIDAGYVTFTDCTDLDGNPINQ